MKIKKKKKKFQRDKRAFEDAKVNKSQLNSTKNGFIASSKNRRIHFHPLPVHSPLSSSFQSSNQHKGQRRQKRCCCGDESHDDCFHMEDSSPSRSGNSNSYHNPNSDTSDTYTPASHSRSFPNTSLPTLFTPCSQQPPLGNFFRSNAGPNTDQKKPQTHPSKTHKPNFHKPG